MATTTRTVEIKNHPYHAVVNGNAHPVTVTLYCWPHQLPVHEKHFDLMADAVNYAMEACFPVEPEGE